MPGWRIWLACRDCAKFISADCGTLLFKVRAFFHFENRVMPGFALIVSKNGPKMRKSTAAEATISFGKGLKLREEVRYRWKPENTK